MVFGYNAEEGKQRFTQFFDAYSREILRYVQLRVAEKEDAEDIASQTFLRLWSFVKEGAAIQQPRAFLFRIAHGLIIDHYRKQGIRRTEPLPENGEILDTSPISDGVAKEVQDVLPNIRALRAEYQEVILLHYIEDMTISDMADILGLSENNVRVRLHRALASLRKHVAL